MGEHLEDGRREGYIVARENQAGRKLWNEWYSECGRSWRPAARIIPARRYATVIIDCITTNTRPSEGTVDRLRAEIRKLQAETGKRDWYTYGMGMSVYVPHVPMERATAFMERLWSILEEDAQVMRWACIASEQGWQAAWDAYHAARD